MKKFKLPTVPAIIAICLLAVVFDCQAQKYGDHNILIGVNAGMFITNESYCVIIGHDSLAINAKGKDMIWQVDWNEPYILKNPDIKIILEDYYKRFILTNKDDKDYRLGLVFKIINRNNKLIGSDAHFK